MLANVSTRKLLDNVYFWSRQLDGADYVASHTTRTLEGRPHMAYLNAIALVDSTSGGNGRMPDKTIRRAVAYERVETQLNRVSD